MTERQYGREDVDYATWYSDWSKRLAKLHTRAELERMLRETEAALQRATGAHHRAVAATTSMTSQSARRAHARNVVSGEGERRSALRGAIEIHDLFPEHAHV